MHTTTGNLWSFSEHYKVVPTNLGWARSGYNVMGRGVALQAKSKYPKLSPAYGNECRRMSERNASWLSCYGGADEMIILFPVKPLNRQAPWLSWQARADLDLVVKSAFQLAEMEWDRPVVLPLVGCGNGKLEPDDVIPILETLLDDRFTLVLF